MKFETAEEAKAALTPGTQLKDMEGEKRLRVVPFSEYLRYYGYPVEKVGCVAIVTRYEETPKVPRWLSLNDLIDYEIIPITEMESSGIRPATEYMDLLNETGRP